MTVHSGPAEPGPGGEPGASQHEPRPAEASTDLPPSAVPPSELPPEPTTAEILSRAPVEYTLEPFATPPQEQAFAPLALPAPQDSGVPAEPPYPVPGQYPAYGPPAGYPMPPGYPVPYSPPVPPQNWVYGYPPPPVPPPPQTGRRARLLLIPAAVVLVLALVVVGLVVFRARTSTTDPVVAGSTTRAARTAGATSSAPQPPASQAPSPTAPDLTQPDGALALSDQAATTQLEQDAESGRGTMQTLQGKWVPQVDGKCVGVAVDIGPAWVPDGTIDTQSVTIQQILGFHISLRNRFGAVTAYQTEVGVASQTATSGACQGKIVWFSVVPQGFASPDDANNWCGVNVPPVKECEARYVARPGEKTNVKHRY